MDCNPFMNKSFIKDIKWSFVPQSIFAKNKYNYNIIECKFLLKKNNLVQIIIKLTNGDKYEYTYILGNEFIKEDTQIFKNIEINEDITMNDI